MTMRILEADLSDSRHAAAIVELVDLYARELNGGGAGLHEQVKATMIAGLRATPTTRVFLAYADDRAVGVAVCFAGYSTFRGKPLINIHDLAVHPDCRGRGVGTTLLAAIEQAARDAGCCAVTLEVDQSNLGARRLYERCGFAHGNHGQPQHFMKKLL